MQNAKEISTVSIPPPDAAGSVEPSQNVDFDPSGSVYIDEGTILTFSSDDVLGYSSMSFGNFTSAEPTTSELPTIEEQINLVKDFHSNDPNVLLQEDLPGETSTAWQHAVAGQNCQRRDRGHFQDRGPRGSRKAALVRSGGRLRCSAGHSQRGGVSAVVWTMCVGSRQRCLR